MELTEQKLREMVKEILKEYNTEDWPAHYPLEAIKEVIYEMSGPIKDAGFGDDVDINRSDLVYWENKLKLALHGLENFWKKEKGE